MSNKWVEVEAKTIDDAIKADEKKLLDKFLNTKSGITETIMISASAMD